MVEQPIYVEVPPPFYMNQSRWKSYQDCDRLYAWDQIGNIVTGRPRKPLITGSAVHKAQVLIHSKSNTPESIAEGVKLAEDYYREKMKRPGPELPFDEKEMEEGLTVLRRMIPAYHRHWKDLGRVWKPLGMELSFCVEVGEGTNVFLVGTLDNLVVLDGNLWLVDYKTMAKLDLREFMKYEIDIQLTAYIYGGTKQLTLDARKEGKPPVVIRGAIIDGLIKTTDPQFHREIYTRSVDDLRQFELEFCMKVWEIAAKHAMVKKDRPSYDLYINKMYQLGSSDWKIAFPKNTQQCFRYGTCDFRDLCVKDTPTARLAFHTRTPDYVDAAAAGKKVDSVGEKP